MKISFIPLILSAVLLTGCSQPLSTENSSSTADVSKFVNAKNITDIADSITVNSSASFYSECPDGDSLRFYFGALHDDDFYIIEHNGEKYALFSYVNSDYGVVMEDVENVGKSFVNGKLTVRFDMVLNGVDNEGCFPNLSYADFIIKLDEDISYIEVFGKKYTPYDGGVVYAEGLTGALDKNMDIILPVKYEMIRPESYFHDASGNCLYYNLYDGKNHGLADSSYNIVLEPEYGEVIIVSDDRFIVGAKQDGRSSLSDARIALIDRQGNIIHDYIDGWIMGYENFSNPVGQAILTIPEGDFFPVGVVDSQLNMVIPPVYKNITSFDIGSDDAFYVVENDREEYAVIDSSGKQQTDFEKTSVYEVQTAYYEKIRKY